MTKFSKSVAAVMCTLVALVASPSADAQESHSTALAKYITPDVVGVFYIDLDKLDLDATIQTAEKLGFQEQGEPADLFGTRSEIKSEVEKFKQAGISRAYALLRSSDITTQGTSWVMPLKPGSDPKAASEAFESASVVFRQHFLAEVGSTEDAVLASTTKSQMDRLKNSRPVDSNARQEMWDAIGNGAVGIVLFCDDDSRRVIRELMPHLPAPFESITGNLIADGVDWGGAELSLGKTPNLKIEIQAQAEEAARTIEQTLVEAYSFLKQLPLTKQYVPESEQEFVFSALAPMRQGTRLTVSTKQLTGNMDRLAKVLAPHVKKARAAAAKSQRLETLRQFGVAIHNFESANGHFPTQGTCDKNGKLMLSWRVQILPFLGEQALWKQFHHDEPWDSEHNLKLINKMPKIFKDSNPGSHVDNKAGKTIYLGAAGEGMIFNGSKEFIFSDMIDGSSNTIQLGTVAREHAVPWTKPIDWQIDLKNPTALLKEEGRTEVEVALADGSTHQFSIDMDAETWRRLVQYDDGEIVEFPR